MVPVPEVQWTTGNAEEDQADAIPNSPERPAPEAQADAIPNSPERSAPEAQLNTADAGEDQADDMANSPERPAQEDQDQADATPNFPEGPAPVAQLTTDHGGEDEVGAVPNSPEGDIGILPADEKVSDDTKGDIGILPADEKVSDDTKVSKTPRRSIVAMCILVFLVPCLAWITCVASLPAESSTKMFAQRVACSFGEGCERHMTGIQALQEPSNRLKEWLCANVPQEEEEEHETPKDEKGIRQAEADAEQEKVSKEILATTELDLLSKVLAGSFTGVLGSLAYIGWWPSHTKKI